MAYRDLRDFIGTLDKLGELKRVPVEVDWKYEAAGWIRKCIDAGQKGPAILLEKIKGYPAGYRIFSGGLASHRRMAIALGLDPATPKQEIIKVFRKRIEKPLLPVMVKSGPVKENVITGDKIDVLRLPVPWWTPRDAGRFIGTWHGCVTKNADSGIRNVGMYRVQVHDRNHTGVGLLPFAQATFHHTQRELKNEPMDMAIVIGADETVPMCAATGFAPDEDEFGFAGALRQEPIEMVKCETIDMEVPANSEIVIEGRVLPHVRKQEGPFGEFAGYHGSGVRLRPVFEVTAILHRNDPILRGTLLGKPIIEESVLLSVVNSGTAMKMFESHGPRGVKAVYFPPEGAPPLMAVVQMQPRYVGHSRDVGRTLLASAAGQQTKYAIIVDEDIDIFDQNQLWWAIITRTQGDDYEILPFSSIPRSDPSIPPHQGEYGTKIIVDATKNLNHPYNEMWNGHFAPVCYPDEETMNLVDMKWNALDGAKGELEQKIGKLSKDIEAKVVPYWEEWRKKYYTMSEEEEKRELGRSRPVVSKVR